MRMACIIFISIFLSGNPWSEGKAQGRTERSSFQWNQVQLRAALDSLMSWHSESIIYLDNDVEGKKVSAACSNCEIDQALSSVLNGTSLMWIRKGSQIILKQQGTPITRPSSTISGMVVDSQTNDWIQGAIVVLQLVSHEDEKKIKRWCPTNGFGFFSFPRIPSGQYVLTVQALGYKPLTVVLDSLFEESVSLNVNMIPQAIVMGEVTIVGNRSALASAEQFSYGVYRRSVPSDQNQYMLDGGRIYNPSHLGGVMSTFSPEILTDVQSLLGGLPPSYGGRLGGIMDLSVRNGGRLRYSASAGMGSLGSQLSLEGPINERTTFLVSGRRGYPDVAWRFLSRPSGAQSRTYSSEITSKITHRLSNSDQIAVSGYWNRDSYGNSVQDSGEELDNDFSWGNSMVNLRWIGVVSSSIFLHSSAVYSRYDFQLHHELDRNSVFYASAQRASEYSIEDWSIDAHAESYYAEDHTFRAGVEMIHHAIHGTMSEFSTQIARFPLQNPDSWEAAIYIQDQWKISPQLVAELGGRIGSFTSDRGTFSSIDPRFSLLLIPNEKTHLYSSLSVINQYLHPYRNSGVFLFYPTLFWYPSTEMIRPSTSLHVTLGIERSMMDDSYLFSAETYYRITNNLHEFRYDTAANHFDNLEQLSLSGTGKTYGMQLSFRKRLGALTGSVHYILSWFNESFSEIDGGKEFAPPFDRRHELQLASTYTINEHWSIGMLCVAATGQTGLYKSNTVPENVVDNRGVGVSANNRFDGFSDVNGSKLPGFQRLELNVTSKFVIRDMPWEFTFRLMNSYGLINPFDWKLVWSYTKGLSWSAAVKDIHLFPLYPVAEVIIRF
jgi:hypothetical protein